MLMTNLEIKRMQIADNVITPYFSENQQPASYDLTLGNTYLCYGKRDQLTKDGYIIDAANRELGPNILIHKQKMLDEELIIDPGQFVLADTVETIKLPNDVAARFEGKSTLGRFGLTTHITAGFIDPGFEGTLTLELKNDNCVPIKLAAGMAIGQICFYQLDHPVSRPYGSPGLRSHYQHQSGPTIPS